ncbi:MAG: glycosyl hydrolase [Saprospiraceae bacterium]|nr:glycosyl hydrolase [Saprospiraceae bacterium]
MLFCWILTAQEDNSTEGNDQPSSYFEAMKWRCIGPFRGGRSVCATGVPGDPLTYYMGTTGGGLWKTEDAGHSWKNISDGFFKTGSVGAIAVANSDPNVLYCGMGEHAPRAVMTSHGDGVYKSTDAGKTWKRVGLENTQHISRIRIHPDNPDIVFVAAQGALYGKNEDRGIYKSEDGGMTWRKVLYVDDHTGCSEISMDANNPRILYATMWEHGRLPWKVISGGPGSGVYKSVDAGETWEKIEKGLPDELGKMAITVSPANSEKVYAVIESDSEKEQGGLFVSENAGKSWKKVSSDHRLVQRAWYYIEVFADPENENMVYVMSAPALRSIDGGKTWERLSGTHGDFHDLWINADNPRNMVIANDGGAAITFNRGESWSPQDNMPTAQFYRINVDNHTPYRIYGGQQDNTSVRISSQSLGGYAITERDWSYSAGGESAFLAFDPDNPRYVWGGSYLGTIEILDVEANATTNVMAAPIQYLGKETKDMRYRFNWNAPIIWSKHEPNTYYHGAQYVLRTQDNGRTWEEVSPDLTRDEEEKQGKGGGPYTNEAVGAENYGTISYMIESPHEKGVIWVASDDGLVHLTRNGGEKWDDVTPKGLDECLVNAIDISPHDPATAYIATTRYKFNDHTPGIYKTTNYGKSWENISKGIPDGFFTRVIREDKVKKGLLYCGTEKGVFVSFNDGQTWEPLQLNLPVTPITDLMVHNGDLVAATSGRSFWILDDLNLLHQYSDDRNGLYLYTPQPPALINGRSALDANSGSFDGTDGYTGVNPATGAVLYYQLPELPDSGKITMEITDAKGNLVRSFSSQKDTTYKRWDGGPPPEPVLSKKEGLNRFVWDLRYPTISGVPGVYIEASYRGHKVIPGEYTVTIKTESGETSTTCEVKPHPISAPDMATYEQYHKQMALMESTVDNMHRTVNKVKDLRTQLEGLVKQIPAEEKYTPLKKEANKMIQEMKEWDEMMVQRKSKAYDDVENFENKLSADYMFMINQAEGDIPRINEPVMEVFHELSQEWSALQNTASNILNRDIPRINQQLWNAGVGALMALPEVKSRP